MSMPEMIENERSCPQDDTPRFLETGSIPELPIEAKVPEKEPEVSDLQQRVERLEERHKSVQELATKIEHKRCAIEDLQKEVKAEKKELDVLVKELTDLCLSQFDSQLRIVFPKNEVQAGDDTWRERPVSDLDGLTERQIELLQQNFVTVGQLCDWLGNDWSEKIVGIGPALKDKIRESIDQIAGITGDKIRAVAEEARAKRLAAGTEEECVNETHSDSEELAEFIRLCNSILDEVTSDEFDPTFVEDVLEQAESEGFFTDEQKRGVQHIAEMWIR